ncbi:MAG: PDZ domain-containing protein [Patescibacteria group bacterium]
MFDQYKNERSKIIILVLLISMIVGFAAGAVGNFSSRSLFLNYFLDTRLLQDLNSNFYELLSQYKFISQSGGEEPLEIVIRRSENSLLGTAKQIQVGGLLDNLEQGTVNFFVKKDNAGSDVLLSSYFDDESLGRGFILTNDGWLVTTKQVIKGNYANYVVATKRGETYSIERVIADSLTEAVFCKIAATNLPILHFNKSQIIQPGQVSLTLGGAGGTKIVNIQNTFYQPANQSADRVMSSEQLDNYILTNEDLADAPIGSPVIDDQGQVIGLVVSWEKAKVILPLNNFAVLINQVLKDQQVQRIYLGVNYLDLSHLVLAADAAKEVRQLGRGALLYSNKSLNILGVRPKSPAESAGLLVGDVILKVEGEEINESQSLAQLIQGYKVGDEVSLTVWRQSAAVPEGQELKITVKLEKLGE